MDTVFWLSGLYLFMAKELPYFKFEPGQWENGNIQICTFEEQGVFINVCSMYWQRLGELPYKLALQKICKGNATALDSLINDNIIKVEDGMICIDFLNEQLNDFENVRETNSRNAREGWKKRKNDATALPPQSDPNAIREEEKREEKKKEDKITITWRSSFDFYKSMVFDTLKELSNDKEFISAQARFYPTLDIPLSLEKSVATFWGTEAGWKHKKRSKSKDIDIRSTLVNALSISSNKVYKQNGMPAKQTLANDQTLSESWES